jgi:sugar phosphate isomerase/epimerase
MNLPFKIGFSTIGTPDSSFAFASKLARKYDLDFLELRSLGGSIDLPSYFQCEPLPDDHIDIRLLGSSLCLLSADDESLDAFFRYAQLACRLRVPYIRVFGAGGADFGDFPTAGELGKMAVVIRRIQETLKNNRCNCEPLLETHDVLSSSERCQALNERLDTPIKILWDSHHTWRHAGESPETTWKALGPLIAHVHYKDSISKAGCLGGHYVTPGNGEYPHARLAALLKSRGYKGGVSLEWEKLWHPSLPEISEVLPMFTGLFR